MRQVPAAVSIIAAAAGDQWTGLTATAVTSVSADPPTLLVCVNRAARSAAIIDAAGRFSVNVLAAAQLPLAQVFSGATADRFRYGAWSVRQGRAPALEGAVACFQCEVEACWPQGTHLIFLGRVTEAAAAGGKALVYGDRAYGAFRRFFDRPVESAARP